MLSALQAKLKKTEKPTPSPAPGLVTDDYVSDSSSEESVSDNEITSAEEGSFTSAAPEELTYGGIV